MDSEVPGAPLPIFPIRPDHLVAEVGDEENGINVVLRDHHLLFTVSHEGASMFLGITIDKLLDDIGKHTRANES